MRLLSTILLSVTVTISLFGHGVQCITYSNGELAIRWMTNDNVTLDDNQYIRGLDCYVFDLREPGQYDVVYGRDEHVYETDDWSVYQMIDLCIEIQSQPNYHERMKRSLFNILEGIYPGTKWCGRGNVAQNFTDLGYYNLTDSCCRDHDSYCDEYIVSGDTKYGITNVNRYTICDCECDAKFRQCLEDVSTFTSNAVGSLFFNVAGIRCLERRPVIRRGIEGMEISLVTQEPYRQRRRVSLSSFGKVLAGEMTFSSFVGGLFGR